MVHVCPTVSRLSSCDVSLGVGPDPWSPLSVGRPLVPSRALLWWLLGQKLQTVRVPCHSTTHPSGPGHGRGFESGRPPSTRLTLHSFLGTRIDPGPDLLRLVTQSKTQLLHCSCSHKIMYLVGLKPGSTGVLIMDSY